MNDFRAAIPDSYSVILAFQPVIPASQLRHSREGGNPERARTPLGCPRARYVGALLSESGFTGFIGFSGFCGLVFDRQALIRIRLEGIYIYGKKRKLGDYDSLSESGFTRLWDFQDSTISSLIGKPSSVFVLGFTFMVKSAGWAKQNPENPANPANPDSDKDARPPNDIKRNPRPYLNPSRTPKNTNGSSAREPASSSATPRVCSRGRPRTNLWRKSPSSRNR